MTFQFVNAINSGKVDDNLDTKQYVPYVVNKQFSYFTDTIFIANELNQRPLLDNDQQFSFYINIVRPKKRFTKWSKADKSEDINMLSEYFECNIENAKTAASILSDDQLAEIKKFMDKGGVVK